jgi:antitoxin (DNA-binding transcriptional repressor) of toxin-antitoxin stability system
MISKDIKEAAELFEELTEKVINGEEVLITQYNIPVAKLIPFSKKKKSVKRKIRAGSAKGMIKILDDFDNPLDEFKNYME